MGWTADATPLSSTRLSRSDAGRRQGPGREPMTEERARDLLTRERRRVERSLAVATGEREDEDELSTVDQHPADYATELYNHEMDETTVEHLREELDAIDRAFKRIEEGTYGLSVDSGKADPGRATRFDPL